MWGDSGGRDSRGTRGAGGEERPGAIYAERIALRDIWDMSSKIQVLSSRERYVYTTPDYPGSCQLVTRRENQRLVRSRSGPIRLSTDLLLTISANLHLAFYHHHRFLPAMSLPPNIHKGEPSVPQDQDQPLISM